MYVCVVAGQLSEDLEISRSGICPPNIIQGRCVLMRNLLIFNATDVIILIDNIILRHHQESFRYKRLQNLLIFYAEKK